MRRFCQGHARYRNGANDFFVMSVEKAGKSGIPEEYFVKAIGRTRDVPGDEITHEIIERLERQGRPALLLTLRSDDREAFPDSVRRLLQEGERLGPPKRPLIAQRKPWYKMDVRVPPPLLFAYLGRRNSRFIRNAAGVVSLTGFLCVYPKDNREACLEQMWRILNHLVENRKDVWGRRDKSGAASDRETPHLRSRHSAIWFSSTDALI
jgi:hypothetical protein